MAVVCRNHLSGPGPGERRGRQLPQYTTLGDQHHHQAGDRAPGDLPGHGGDPGPLLLHLLLLTFPTLGQCRPLASPAPAAAASPVSPHRHQQQQRPDCFLLQMTSTQLSWAGGGPGLQPSTAQLSHLAEAACRIVWVEQQSTQYLHSIYTVSTQ